MSDLAVPLRAVRLPDASRVGGKAASLGELLAGGVRVPTGVVLTVAAARASAAERAAVVMSLLPALGPGPYAVRSSAVGEDGAHRSFAGQFETLLDVASEAVPDAIERCLASGRGGRALAYAEGGHMPMAVVVQRMIEAEASGVAMTADPIRGDRGTCVVTAVRGLGERLVSGETPGDEWVIRDAGPVARRQPERAISRGQAAMISDEARRIANMRGEPQDIEWALDRGGTLWILQARPMTALPPAVSWDPPVRGAFSRAFRFGEWIAEPVTPLFESWLLSAMEERLHELHTSWIGQVAPHPHHVVVNGWYFYSLNFLPVPGASLGRSLPAMMRVALREPRRLATMFVHTAHHAVPLYEREWREDLQPRYRAAVEEARTAVEELPVTELPSLVDRLARLAGEYFASIAVVAGSGYKIEANLGAFYRRHLVRRIGGTHLSLLGGLSEPPDDAAAHTVESLDWWHPPRPAGAGPEGAMDRAAIIEARHAAEEAAFTALRGSPRRLRAFRRLLTTAQRLAPIREEQVRELTLPWPVLRRAVARIGEELVARGAIAAGDDTYFLTREELFGALGGSAAPLADVVARRRVAREEALRLMPPLVIGRMPRMLRLAFALTAQMHGARPSERALAMGAPASPGRASGPVRVIRSSREFGQLRAGEILVAPLTTPAWTPLFRTAAGVVTDVGSALSHASVIAREYGIPAVVGCEDATVRLTTGSWVTVDGGRGTVEPAATDQRSARRSAERAAQ